MSTRREFFSRDLPMLLIATFGAIYGTRFLKGSIFLPSEDGDAPPKDFELNDEEIRNIASISVDDYNRVLNANISKEQTLQSVILVETLKEYQEIISRVETGYIPTDELDRPAITTDGKIYIYKEFFDKITGNLPRDEKGSQARRDLLEFVITHEMAHWSAVRYSSDELHNLVYLKMFANRLQDTHIEQGFVQGAEVKAYADGVLKSTFQNLEEAEAYLIGLHVMQNRGRPDLIPYPPSTVSSSSGLLENLLSGFGPDHNSNIIALSNFRMQSGGREELCKKIGQIYNFSPEDQLFASMSILYSVDTGNRSLYTQLTTPQQ